jgi:hypothetical protein
MVRGVTAVAVVSRLIMIALEPNFMAFLSLKTALDISPEEQSRLGEYNDKIKDVAEFFSDAVEAMKDSSFMEALETVAPWVGEAVDSAGIPFVKFATSLLGKLLKQKDPEVLGRLACTLAYQRASVEAIKKVGQPDRKRDSRSVGQELRDFRASSVVDFKSISLTNALSHEFIKEADRALIYYSEKAGYSERQQTSLQTLAHRYFVENLRIVLTHRETADKFEPFRNLIQLGAHDLNPYASLENHIEYQRRLFEEARLFNTEPFALQHIYVEGDCTKRKWSEVSREQIDPLKPVPRIPLVEAVMTLIGDRAFDDAIVIQGVAGAGKSSLTLKLCRVLHDHGLIPIRIRLRDVPLDMNIRDALPKAVLLHDPDTSLTERGHRAPNDVFGGGQIFRERISYDGLGLCPYVLVLDGWDEISLAAPAGFRSQVTRMLKELREEYLKNREPKIRVIVTGRPSVDVNESHFLLQNTPLLEIQTLTPDQLSELIDKVVRAIETAPLSEIEKQEFKNRDALDHILEDYRSRFAETKQPTGVAEIFSLPLLAHLALRLVAVSTTSIEEMLQNPTNLYRSLVDETVWRRGRFSEGTDPVVEQIGPDLELRRRLQETAAAITVYQKETIPFRELAIRLGFKPAELENFASDSTKNHVLTELLINFFFKGGNLKLGCEFLHKSFREYLYAEHLIEILKAFGRSQTAPWPERSEKEYWKDFPEKSHLYTLSRRLAESLSSQWISKEVANHLWALIGWEIGRSDASIQAEEQAKQTKSLTTEKWEYVRDGLADLWDWWGEGVHLRRPVSEDKRGPVFGSAYVDELTENIIARDFDSHQAGMLTARSVTADAHLGDALFRLNVLVHFGVAQKQGWLFGPTENRVRSAVQCWEGVSKLGDGPRRYQTLVRQDNKAWVLFCPAGINPNYFQFYASRINAAGWRSPFPSGIRLLGVDLRETKLWLGTAPIVLDRSNVSDMRLVAGEIAARMTLAAGLKLGRSEKWATRLQLILCDLRRSFIADGFGRELASVLLDCDLRDADLSFADLFGARFNGCAIDGANFRHAHFERTEFTNMPRPDVAPAEGVSGTENGTA